MNDEETQEDNEEQRNPKAAFFLMAPVINSNNTIDVTESVIGTCDTLSEALELASDHAEGEGEEVFIYECRPVRRVSRHVKVTVMMKSAIK